MGENQKSSIDAIKALHLQCLDTSGTSELPTLRGWAIARHKSPISHIRRQALPEGFIYKRAEKLSQGRQHIGLVLVWYQRMQIHYK